MAPPRGKKGERRLDAALDALIPMGFSTADITKAANKLLKVYDGNWIFIEEGSYKLLIESLVDGDEDGSEPGAPLLMNEAVNEDDNHGNAGSSSALRPAKTPLDDVSFPRYNLRTQRKRNPPPAAATIAGPAIPRTNTISPPKLNPPPPAAGPAIPRASNKLPPKRNPCYGWWGDDSDDEIIELPKMQVHPRK